MYVGSAERSTCIPLPACTLRNPTVSLAHIRSTTWSTDYILIYLNSMRAKSVVYSWDVCRCFIVLYTRYFFDFSLLPKSARHHFYGIDIFGLRVLCSNTCISYVRKGKTWSYAAILNYRRREENTIYIYKHWNCYVFYHLILSYAQTFVTQFLMDLENV